MNDILEFKGKNRWLSNFDSPPVYYEGVRYPSVEAAYQAAKTLDLEARKRFTQMLPGDAKRIGSMRSHVVREDWDSVRVEIMRDLVTQKFSVEPYRSKLAATGDCLIVEGNYWGDVFWGVCRGVGENVLGKIIMEVRAALAAGSRADG